MQHLAHVRLAGWASNQIDTPPVNPTYCQNWDIDLLNSTDLSFPQRSSSCIQRLDRPQLPAMIIQLHSTTRPTSATRNDRPAAFNDSTDLSYLQRSSRCIQRLDPHRLPATIIQLHSTTRPTSATRNDRPAAFNDSTDLSLPASNIQLYFHDSTYVSYPHRTSSCAHLRLNHTSYRHHPSSWRPITTATDFTYAFVIPTINRHFCCICYLAFVPFIVFGCHYSHALNLSQLRGRHAYRLRNTPSVLPVRVPRETAT